MHDSDHTTHHNHPHKEQNNNPSGDMSVPIYIVRGVILSPDVDNNRVGLRFLRRNALVDLPEALDTTYLLDAEVAGELYQKLGKALQDYPPYC